MSSTPPAILVLLGRVFASETAFSRSYAINSGTVASAPRDVFTAADQSGSSKLPMGRNDRDSGSPQHVHSLLPNLEELTTICNLPTL